MILFAQNAVAQDHGAKVFQQVSGAVAWVESISPDSLHVLRGSGVVLKDQGWLVSNFHAWAKGGVLSARLGDVPLRLGKTITADKGRDVLVVEVLGTEPEIVWDGVPALSISKANKLKPGQDAYALGNPRGVELTISHGLVSGIRSHLNDTASKLVQFSAPISEGNSGGALVDARGVLIGIPTVHFSDGGGQALNFAIPVDRILDAVADPRMDVPEPDSTWLEGLQAYKQGRLEDAAILFDRVVRAQGSTSFDAAYFVGRSLQRSGALKEAKTLYESMLVEDPFHAYTCYRLGEVLFELGDVEAAMKYKSRAISVKSALAAGTPPY